MKKYLFLLSLFAFFWISCSSDEVSHEETSESNMSVEDSVEHEEVLTFEEASFTIDVNLEGLNYKGEKVFACSWNDARGENILIHSEYYTDWIGEVRSAYLYSYHYVRTDTGFYLFRLVQDNYEDCDFDVMASFRAEPYITDINEDEYAEVTVCYELGCRSDVSENDMKVIMYDQTNKYGLRGAEYIIFPDEELDEKNFNPNMEEVSTDQTEEPDWSVFRGRYKNEKDFVNAPQGYLEHAKSVWMENVFTRF